jgi:aminopeptidase
MFGSQWLSHRGGFAMSLEFEQNLKKYAEVIVKVGLNLQPGQRLVIGAPVLWLTGTPIETAPLVRLIVAQAYQAGARLVDVMWDDERLKPIRLQHASRESLEEFSTWRVDAGIEAAKAGDALLWIMAEDPDLLLEQEPERVAAFQNTNMRHTAPLWDLVSKNTTNWTVISAPVDGWAAKIFPDLPAQSRKAKFWDIILGICRVKHDDPAAAWQDHIKQLVARSKYLTNKHYTALKLTSDGTDLTVGLPSGHIWGGGWMTTQNGIDFVANLPTEEICTMPHKEKTEGVVTATKPLSYGGSLVEDFSLTFSAGRVVKVTAKTGETSLRKLLETDKGASALGEVALVPHSSPISQTGLIYHNILIDENASCHLALGQAYRVFMENGEAMSDKEFAAVGGNKSMIHTDFMIGSGEMDVDGFRKDGTAEPIMRGGEWVFEV